MGQFIDLTGQRFGRLTVLERSGYYDKQILWKCKCDCGNVLDVRGMCLRSGHTKSCGCAKHDMLQERNYKHGENRTRLHNIWKAIHNRTNPNNSRHAQYYDKGVCVCEEWSEYVTFAKWARENGYQDDLTIDRIDVNGNYCPENCRWVSYKVQGNNKTNNVRITYNGETRTLSEWADITGINYGTLGDRYERGYEGDELFAKSLVRKTPVISIDNDGNETFYASIREACEKVGINDSCIRRACKGETKTSAGLRWRYA